MHSEREIYDPWHPYSNVRLSAGIVPERHEGLSVAFAAVCSKTSVARGAIALDRLAVDGENFPDPPRLPEPYDLAAPGRAAGVDTNHVATREDLLATILGGLLALPRGKVALLEARFTDELLDVLAPDVQVPASVFGPRPEPVGSPLVVAAILIVADTAETSRERVAAELISTLQAANAVGCVIMPCRGDADEGPCSSRGAVLVIIPTASLDKL